MSSGLLVFDIVIAFVILALSPVLQAQPFVIVCVVDVLIVFAIVILIFLDVLLVFLLRSRPSPMPPRH